MVRCLCVYLCLPVCNIVLLDNWEKIVGAKCTPDSHIHTKIHHHSFSNSIGPHQGKRQRRSVRAFC